MVADPAGSDREILIRALKLHEDIIILAQVSDATSTLKTIVEMQPDLVFMEINLPGKDGFMLLDELKTLNCHSFEFIFYTHCRVSALKALKYGALDYLLKPLYSEELTTALVKFRNKMNSVKINGDLNTAINGPSVQISSKKCIPTNKRNIYLAPEDIVFIKGNGGHSIIHDAKNNEYETCKILKYHLCRLQHPNLIRIYKNTVINKNYLIDSDDKKKTCTLNCGDQNFTFNVSRRQFGLLK